MELLRPRQQPRARRRSRPTPAWSAASRSPARCWSSPTCCTPACSSRSRWRCCCVVLLIAGSPFLPWLPGRRADVGAARGLRLRVRPRAQRARGVLPRHELPVGDRASRSGSSPRRSCTRPTLLEARAPTWVQNVLKLNPMNGFVEVYRRCLYDAGAPGWRTMLALAAVSFVSLAARLGDLPPVRPAASGRGVTAATRPSHLGVPAARSRRHRTAGQRHCGRVGRPGPPRPRRHARRSFPSPDPGTRASGCIGYGSRPDTLDLGPTRLGMEPVPRRRGRARRGRCGSTTSSRWT